MIIGNGHEHKCPCCGYEVEVDWNGNGYDYIKGDEDFIKIINQVDRMGVFETDKKDDYYESYYCRTKEVILLGCPKCSCVSYKFW